MPTGLGDEQLWLSATNDNTGTSTAFDDQSGNSNNGTASGTTVVADTGAGGSYAFSLNGSSDYIDVVSSGIPATAYSVSVWQNSSRSSNASSIVFNAGDASNNRVVNLDGVRNGTSGDAHGHRSSGTNYWVTNTVTRSQGTWYHYLLTYDGSSLRIYVDGQLINTRSSVPNTTYTETKCWIGQFIGSGFFFQGMADDIRTYGRALTQAEITHLASSRGVEGKPFEGLGDEQLWLSATNDNTGTSAAFQDQSGNSNNGTASGTTVVADTSEGGTYAFEFDGISDCITTTYAPTSATSTGVFSMACWVKYDSVAASMALMSGNIQTGKTGLAMNFDTFSSDRGHVGILNHNVSGQYSSRIFAGDRDTTLTGQWYHIAHTGDGTTARLYVDGSEVVSGSFNGFSALAWSNPLQIGRYFTGISTAGGHLNGRLDDLRFFTRTITQAEIVHLASSRGVEGPPPVGLGDEKLWLCPSLNDSADDISGNGNNGAYQGGMGTVADTGEGGSLAYDFDGTDDWIDFSVAPDTSSNDFVSYSAWINIDNQSAVVFPILADRNGNTSGWVNFAVLVDGTSLSHRTYVPNSWYTLALTQQSGSWVHLAQVRDKANKEIHVYADGVFIGTSTHTGSTTHIGGEFSIGKWDTGTSGGGSARVDDIRYYERALTQAEITHLATSRGIEGSPSTPSTQYNAFVTHAFKQLFQTRLR